MDKPNTKKIGYCSSMPSLPKQGKFIGCDGKAWSDDFVKWHLQKAVDEVCSHLIFTCVCGLSACFTKYKTKSYV